MNPSPTFIIRPFQPSDARALTDLFFGAIHEVATQYYTREQVNAWAPRPIDYHHWSRRFADIPPLVALLNNRPVGFMSLENTGHIHWAYTHSQYQRQGIASRLYQYIEEVAKSKGLTLLFTEASHLAKPFFIKQGFRQRQKNAIKRNNQILTNWTMDKQL